MAGETQTNANTKIASQLKVQIDNQQPNPKTKTQGSVRQKWSRFRRRTANVALLTPTGNYRPKSNSNSSTGTRDSVKLWGTRKPDKKVASLVNRRAEDASDFVDDTISELEDFNVGKSRATNLFRSRRNLFLDTRTLEEYHLAARTNQWRRGRNKFRQCGHRSSSDLIEGPVQLCILRSGADYFDVLETKRSRLRNEPVHATFHGFNQDHGHIRPSDCQDQSWKSSTTADITNGPGLEKWSQHRTIEDMSTPEPRKLEWTN